jgi:hypothetical protein
VNTTDHSGSDVEGIAWVASTEGLAQIRMEWWTLEKKAYLFEDMIRARHNRFGIVDTVQFHIYGNISSYYKLDGDNDGSYTALCILSIGQCSLIFIENMHYSGEFPREQSFRHLLCLQ